MMPFPNTVDDAMPWGIVGESYLGVMGSINAQPLQLSSEAAENIFGRALTHVEGENGIAVVGGDGVFAGIMAFPKEHIAFALPGVETTTVPEGTVVSGVTEHPGLIVTLTTAAAIGDGVAFAADGSLAAAPAQVAPANHTLIPGSKVVRYNVNQGIAVVSFKELPTPAAAAE